MTQGDEIQGDVGTTVTAIARMPGQEQPTDETARLKPVTRRGRLVLAHHDSDLLELETAHGRVELLGPYGTEAHEGDEVEIVGLPDPTARHPNTQPALLIQQMRRLA
ncbi:MAG TPA: hypothetical protein VFZ85_13975 [Jiangellaceae bacterium]